MKALSLTQPMAWAVFHGKDVENRDRRFAHRGLLLIHASQGFNTEHYTWIAVNENRLGLMLPQREEFVHGALIGVVTVVDCISNKVSPIPAKSKQVTESAAYGSRWFFGPYGLVLRDARAFKHPVPYRGWPGLFNVPDEIVREEVALCIGSAS